VSHRPGCEAPNSTNGNLIPCTCDHRTIVERVRRDFTYHQPDAATSQAAHRMRDYFLALAEEIVDHVPNGREQANALTRLEEAMMHAIAGIVRP